MMAHNKAILSFTLALALTTGLMHQTYGMGKGEDIARRAELYRGSTAWAYMAQKDQRGSTYTFDSKSWKCNLFVYDMLFDSGITPPVTADDWVTGKKGGWPITAAMWTQNVPRFSRVSSQQRGDIVSDGVHCGIATDDALEVVAAGEFSVDIDRTFYVGNYPTVQRYEGF